MEEKRYTSITDAELTKKGVVSLAIRPNQPSQYGLGGLSAKDLQKHFDELARLISARLNTLGNALTGEQALAYLLLPEVLRNGNDTTLEALLKSIYDSQKDSLRCRTATGAEKVLLDDAIIAILEAINTIKAFLYPGGNSGTNTDNLADIYSTILDTEDKISKAVSKHDVDGGAHGTKFAAFRTQFEEKLQQHNGNDSAHSALFKSVGNQIAGCEDHISKVNDDTTTAIKTLDDAIKALQAVINEFFATDADNDENYDRLVEIVAYLNANKDLIDSLRNDKIDKTSIAKTFDENVEGKVLSATLGPQIKQGLVSSKAKAGIEDFLFNSGSLGLKYLVDSTGATCIFEDCPYTDIYIPDHIQEYTVWQVSGFSDSPITSVIIPYTVSKIERNAFEGCNKLKSVTFKEGINNSRLTIISNEAFKGCTSLTEIFIPQGGRYIYDQAFANCNNLRSVIFEDGSTLERIMKEAFSGCTSLLNISIPKNVTSIGDDAFYNCQSLESIKVDETNETYKDIAGHLYTKDGKTLIQYAIGFTGRNFTVPEGVESISKHAFAYSPLTGLFELVIPNEVKSIGEGAFEYSHIMNMQIGTGITSIEAKTFAYSDINSINGNGCVNIPNTVRSIYAGAFRDCQSLTNITIPSSVTYIQAQMLYNCQNLESITVDEDNVNYKTVDGHLCSKDGLSLEACVLKKLERIKAIPDGITTIRSFAVGCFTGEKIFIPRTVTSIRQSAFINCDNLTEVDYEGSESEWAQISIESYNDSLTNAMINYNKTYGG